MQKKRWNPLAPLHPPRQSEPFDAASLMMKRLRIVM
jgi:hypothetical protein